MSRFAKKRVTPPPPGDASTMWGALIVFCMLVFVAGAGRLFRAHTVDGKYPLPRILGGFLFITAAATVALLYKRYKIDRKPMPPVLKKLISPDSIV